jgi:hypothetical protein
MMDQFLPILLTTMSPAAINARGTIGILIIVGGFALVLMIS